jgi:calcium/calmodulin-dependent protein kinase I
MVVSKAPEWWVKIADFGVSKRRQPGQTTVQDTSKWLSIDYAAPEQFGLVDVAAARRHPFAIDVWSLGAVVYRLLAGGIPFHLCSLAAYVHGGAFPASRLRDAGVSEAGVDFAAAVMNKLPGSRPLASVASVHAWFDTKDGPVSARPGRKFRYVECGIPRSYAFVAHSSDCSHLIFWLNS